MTETAPEETTPATTPWTGPVRQADRIVALDVLRGFALLGILVMNIQSFAMIFAAYPNPTAYGDLTGINYWVWYFSHLLADQKFMTIFSMLFGAGIVLMAGRREESGLPPWPLHFRRMGVLLLFGLAHAYLLWYGDVLLLYAICGALVFFFRRRNPRFLLILGILVLGIASAVSLLAGLSMPTWPEEQRREFVEGFAPPPEKVEEELAAYRGGWSEQMTRRVPQALDFHTQAFLFWGVWRAGGLMLVGMALFKLGVFSAARSAKFYATLIGVGAVIGLPLVAWGVRVNQAAGWDPGRAFFLGAQYNYWASLLVSMAWVGAVMLICRGGRLEGLTRRLAAVGQMAFTNYILQTVICTTIFYGHGLGLFGSVERIGQISIVFGVWAFQLWLSPVWLRRFRYGPLEWLWRSMSYLRPAPFRRPETAPA